MKTNSLLFLLALSLAFSLFLPGREANADPVAANVSAHFDLCPACKAREKCLADCLKEFEDALERGKDLCETCNFEVLGVCISYSTSQKCIRSHRAKAEDVYDACKDKCLPPVRKPKPESEPEPEPGPEPESELEPNPEPRP